MRDVESGDPRQLHIVLEARVGGSQDIEGGVGDLRPDPISGDDGDGLGHATDRPSSRGMPQCNVKSQGGRLTPGDQRPTNSLLYSNSV